MLPPQPDLPRRASGEYPAEMGVQDSLVGTMLPEASAEHPAEMGEAGTAANQTHDASEGGDALGTIYWGIRLAAEERRAREAGEAEERARSTTMPEIHREDRHGRAFKVGVWVVVDFEEEDDASDGLFGRLECLEDDGDGIYGWVVVGSGSTILRSAGH